MSSNTRTLRQTLTLLPSILHTELEVCNGQLALLSNGDDDGAIGMLVAAAGFSLLCRVIRSDIDDRD